MSNAWDMSEFARANGAIGNRKVIPVAGVGNGSETHHGVKRQMSLPLEQAKASALPALTEADWAAYGRICAYKQHYGGLPIAMADSAPNDACLLDEPAAAPPATSPLQHYPSDGPPSRVNERVREAVRRIQADPGISRTALRHSIASYYRKGEFEAVVAELLRRNLARTEVKYSATGSHRSERWYPIAQAATQPDEPLAANVAVEPTTPVVAAPQPVPVKPAPSANGDTPRASGKAKPAKATGKQTRAKMPGRLGNYTQWCYSSGPGGRRITAVGTRLWRGIGSPQDVCDTQAQLEAHNITYAAATLAAVRVYLSWQNAWREPVVDQQRFCADANRRELLKFILANAGRLDHIMKAVEALRTQSGRQVVGGVALLGAIWLTLYACCPDDRFEDVDNFMFDVFGSASGSDERERVRTVYLNALADLTDRRNANNRQQLRWCEAEKAIIAAWCFAFWNAEQSGRELPDGFSFDPGVAMLPKPRAIKPEGFIVTSSAN